MKEGMQQPRLASETRPRAGTIKRTLPVFQEHLADRRTWFDNAVVFNWDV